MRRIPLNEFASEKGQVHAAALLGMSQGALSKALRVGRAVFVTEHADGSFSAEETRPFPSQPGKTQAA
ncbi:Cro/CI family transcriptional regulator [Pseudomonas indica]|uniref:Cro/CI family transcriptional regulator n=1 Tax=Pseudomonas indica TaxID=137658 RepID=UPI003FD49932